MGVSTDASLLELKFHFINHRCILTQQECRRAYDITDRVEVVSFIEKSLYHIYGMVSNYELHTYHISNSFYLIY